jgi:hypothetical protein
MVIHTLCDCHPHPHPTPPLPPPLPHHHPLPIPSLDQQSMATFTAPRGLHPWVRPFEGTRTLWLLERRGRSECAAPCPRCCWCILGWSRPTQRVRRGRGLDIVGTLAFSPLPPPFRGFSSIIPAMWLQAQTYELHLLVCLCACAGDGDSGNPRIPRLASELRSASASVRRPCVGAAVAVCSLCVHARARVLVCDGLLVVSGRTLWILLVSWCNCWTPRLLQPATCG